VRVRAAKPRRLVVRTIAGGKEMGWWRTGNNDDVVGDVPADGITIQLRELAESLEARGKEKPSWSELLAAINQTVKGHEEQLLDMDAKATPAATGDQPADAQGDGAQDVSPEVLEAISALVKDVVKAYEQHVGRKPRLTEIIHSFRFVCREDPEQYLRDKNI
jgi:hypothetical protein